MLTLVIIAVGVAGVFDAYQNFFRTNQWSSRTATASLLAAEIRELTRTMPRHDSVTGLFIDDSGAAAVARGWGLEPGEVTARDIDDIDDLDGVRFTFTGTNAALLEFAGPIDASGSQIPQYVLSATDEASGTTFTYGWQQTIEVVKVNPFNYGEVLDDAFFEAPSGGAPGRNVDAYPLRVTVTVLYQDFFDPEPVPVTTVTWVVP